MTLSAGTRLGPYEILSLLGSGGMGEVYRSPAYPPRSTPDVPLSYDENVRRVEAAKLAGLCPRTDVKCGD